MMYAKRPYAQNVVETAAAEFGAISWKMKENGKLFFRL